MINDEIHQINNNPYNSLLLLLLLYFTILTLYLLDLRNPNPFLIIILFRN
jgi:hypothetical protein